MKNYNKMIVIIIFAVILTIIMNIVILFILNYSANENKIKKDNEINTEFEEKEAEDNTSEKIHEDKENNIEKSNEITTETLNNDKSIGTIKISKINFEGQIYEGTSLDILEKGVGHFDNSPYLDGNVCLAAHNTKKFWENLKILKKDDIITYESFLGTREYKVSEITEIEETDWSKLENTDENNLTLITCVKGNKPKRLCVSATAI